MDDSDKIPSNSELVDSLINDFKATCDIKPNEDSQNKPESKPSPKEPDFLEESFPDKCPCDVDSSESDKNDTSKKPHSEYFIDEEELKTRQENLSEEELLRLKKEADELKAKGNEQFKSKEFKDSVETYTSALRTCPLKYTKERAILYANRAAAEIKLELTECAVEDCSKAIELDPNYLKALIRRAQLYETTEKLDEALADYQKILEIDPSHTESRAACQRLPIQINERNEKLKTEMMGKLKDLGNMILRPFGLSTNNFQMVQDPNTGGYSINFKQN